MINFSKLHLKDYLTEDVIEKEIVTSQKADASAEKQAQNSRKSKAVFNANTNEHFESLRRQKQAIKMYEAWKSDWRQELNEEHPYVEVMPSTNQEGKDVAEKGVKKAKDLKNEKPNQ